ncbi:MAG: DUF6491 family protein [Rhizomicrobium sp.]
MKRMKKLSTYLSASCLPAMALLTAGILLVAGASWADPPANPPSDTVAVPTPTPAPPTPTPTPPAPAPAKPHQICLDAGNIDHLSYPDDKTIVFHMRGGKVWRNDLKRSCPGLKFEQAIAYEIRGGTICGNMQVVYVMRRWTPCMLGAFTAVPPKDVVKDAPKDVPADAPKDAPKDAAPEK